MQIDAGTLQLTQLLQLVEKGQLALPEFQRNYVWRPDAVLDLITSIARRWPIGSFLVLEVKDEHPFQLRPLEQACDLSDEVKLIVLDGQQRCTSIYHAFTDNSPDVVYYMELPSDWSEFDEEQVKYERKAKFAKRFPNLATMAAAKVVRVMDLHDDTRFEAWKEHLPADERMAAVSFRSNQLSGLKDISIPQSRLSGTVDLRAVAKIFETINITGKRLDTFDLLVARLYPYDFRLRDVWDDALAVHSELRLLNVDGIEVLKLIALRRWGVEFAKGLKLTIKGVKQSDVLELTPDNVKSDWPVALDAYVKGLRFLRERCGVTGPGLLPQPSIPLTIGFFLASDQHHRADFVGDLERWYWASCFAQTYAQGANTQVLSDVKSLRAWNANDGAVPDVVAQFAPSEERLGEGRRLNEMIVRGLLGRQIALGSRDWSSGQPMATTDVAEIHHIFPEDVLDAMPKPHSIPKDPILNFAAISASTNKMIRNEVPGTVLDRGDIDRSSVESHWLRTEWLRAVGDESQAELVQRFLRERLEVVRQEMTRAVHPQGS